MINSVVLMGRLTADPELRTTTSGTSVTRFTLAVDRNYNKSGEERKADFISMIAWRQNAEFICFMVLNTMFWRVMKAKKQN